MLTQPLRASLVQTLQAQTSLVVAANVPLRRDWATQFQLEADSTVSRASTGKVS